MKILLINPPAENTLLGNNPTIIDQERGYNPPLGLLYIAAYLEKYSEFSVEIIDSQAEEIGYSELRKRVEEKSTDIVGITTMSFTLLDVLKTVDLVKQINPETKVVLGGPHCYIYPEETINLPGVDFVILGEGELTFWELASSIAASKAPEDIKGLVFKENGRTINTGIRDLIMDLDQIPLPARHLTPINKYTSLIAQRSPITTMISSRGCPYRCAFCNRPHLGKKFRARTAGNVVDEMEECSKMGIKEVLMYDDTFTIDRQRVIDICDEIVKRDLKIGWDIRARVDNMDRKIIERLKEAHCERIHYGVEAGTAKILKTLKKGITLDKAREAFKLTKEIGISTLGYFMIGSPGETREDILETITFAKSLDPDLVHITITTPFPDTELYREGLKSGVLKKDYWLEFARNPSPNFFPEYWEGELSREELLELVNYAYKTFYTRPGYIFKKLAKVRSAEELKRKIKAGLKVIKL